VTEQRCRPQALALKHMLTISTLTRRFRRCRNDTPQQGGCPCPRTHSHQAQPICPTHEPTDTAVSLQGQQGLPSSSNRGHGCSTTLPCSQMLWRPCLVDNQEHAVHAADNMRPQSRRGTAPQPSSSSRRLLHATVAAAAQSRASTGTDQEHSWAAVHQPMQHPTLRQQQ
jgi:hypothetical protein